MKLRKRISLPLSTERRKRMIGFLLFFLVVCCSPVVLELLYNPHWREMGIRSWLWNVGLWLLLWVALSELMDSYKYSCILVLICSVVLGLVNYYLLRFKYDPLVPADFKAMWTGFKVAGQFSYELTTRRYLFLLGVILLICAVIRRLPNISFQRRGRHLLMGLVLSGCLAGSFFMGGGVNLSKLFGFTTDLWDPENTYFEHGFLISFLEFSQESRIRKPEGYTKKKAEAILLDADRAPFSSDNTRPANLIVIMNEAFSDLAVNGDFETNQDYLPFWNSLDENVAEGYLYVSIFGYNTCNTEFEVLTGNSMANLPAGTLPYVQYLDHELSGTTSILRQNQFHTVAFHPYNKHTWNRPRVYQNLGFEQYLGQGDIKSPEYLRKIVSDKSDVEKIIELCETKTSEHLFIFNVTMQNHGGFDTGLIEKNVRLTGGREGKYPDVDEYLSLIKKTDEAYQLLIEYFSGREEPTVICMFGDHQPGLNREFYNTLSETTPSPSEWERRQNQYKVPYKIWANYEIPERTNEDLSANYLSPYLLELCGIGGNAYYKFLQELRREIPVINVNGYLGSDGIWYQTGDRSSPHYEAIKKYQQVQYYLMFDAKSGGF